MHSMYFRSIFSTFLVSSCFFFAGFIGSPLTRRVEQQVEMTGKRKKDSRNDPFASGLECDEPETKCKHCPI